MSIDSEAMVWFLMRAAYGQEQKAQEFLEAKGIETFLPLQEHCFVRDGKRVKKMQSLIPNFLFVKSTENEMKKYIGKHPVVFCIIIMCLIRIIQGMPLGLKASSH